MTCTIRRADFIPVIKMNEVCLTHRECGKRSVISTGDIRIFCAASLDSYVTIGDENSLSWCAVCFVRVIVEASNQSTTQHAFSTWISVRGHSQIA